MKFDEACKLWAEEALPFVKKQYERDGVPDMPARRESWNNWSDMLCKDGVITLVQYEKWRIPKVNENSKD